MSASPYCPWAFATSKKAEEQAFKLGQKLGLSKPSKEELLIVLYKTPASILVEKAEELGSVILHIWNLNETTIH